MPTWDELIEDYQQSVDDIEAWFGGDDRTTAPDGWSPPEQPPAELPTQGQLDRLQEVHRRDLELRDRLEQALSGTARAIAADVKRAEAARLYRSGVG